MMLLASAALLGGSLLRLQLVDPGFDPEGVLTVSLSLPADVYPQLAPETAAFYREVLDRIESIPGVVAAGATMVNPFLGFNPSNSAADANAVEQSEFVPIRWRTVTTGFFEAMGVPALQGRHFVRGEGDEPVAVIGSSLAEILWPEDDPIGQRVQWNRPDGPLFHVVGVVEAIRDSVLVSEPEPTLYLVHEQVAWPDMTLMIKTEVDPLSVADNVRSEIWAVDGNIPVPVMQPLAENLSQAVASPRLNVQWMAFFALAAVLMASMGLYGIVAFSVSRRTREIGIRVALGARPGATVGMVLRGALRLLAIGVTSGSLGAVLLSRALDSLLFETRSADPIILAVVASTLTVVAVIASYVPARRAAHVDPLIALRAE